MRLQTATPTRAAGQGVQLSPLPRVSVKPATSAAPAPEVAPATTPASDPTQTGPRQALVLRRSLFLNAAAAALAAAAFSLHAPQAATASALPRGATILVVGATGRTGRLAVASLAARGYAVRAAVRDPAKAAALGVAAAAAGGVVTLDLAAPEPELTSALAAALDGVDGVVCAAGFNGGGGGSSYASVDEAGTIALIAAAAARPATIKRFVLLTSILTNGAARGQAWNPAFLILKKALTAKLASEAALRASGLDWVIVRPGGLADKPAAEVGAPVLRGEDALLGLPGDPGRAVARETVADLLASAVAVPAAGGRVLELVASPKVAAVGMDDLVERLAAAGAGQ